MSLRSFWMPGRYSLSATTPCRMPAASAARASASAVGTSGAIGFSA